jgi:hypothetical protein
MDSYSSGYNPIKKEKEYPLGIVFRTNLAWSSIVGVDQSLGEERPSVTGVPEVISLQHFTFSKEAFLKRL